jgi:hypothetical protein
MSTFACAPGFASSSNAAGTLPTPTQLVICPYGPSMDAIRIPGDDLPNSLSERRRFNG